jgi:predicted PurR-regulated permease PerM
VTSTQNAQHEKDLLGMVYDQRKQLYDAIQTTIDKLATVSDASTRDALSRKLEEVIRALQTPSTPRQTTAIEEALSGLTSAVIRIGSVLVGIFLIQITVTFGRLPSG